ncbi:MAG: hypothetical protein KDD04_12245, partial [Sinomicrobium sp.]|nr:hypothetical protein [Sinomicrobium sp.]
MKILNLMCLFLLVSFVSQAQISLPGGVNSIGNYANKIVIGTNNPYWKPGGIELSGSMILLSNATGNVHSWFPFEDGNVYISG